LKLYHILFNTIVFDNNSKDILLPQDTKGVFDLTVAILIV
jgi:hypothetical protein